MSLSQSTNIALSSMKNNQYALTVVAQNIANVNTEGYTRQRVNFATNEYTTDCETVLSTIRGMNGAKIDSLTDFIDDAVLRDLADKNADSEYYKNLLDALGDLEGISDDLGDNGLNSILGDFFKASANLEKYPTDLSIRQQFVMAAENVAEKFNELSTRYDSVKSDKIEKVEFGVEKINSLINDLAQANKTYLDTNGSAAAQGEINNILQELSNYTDVNTQKNSNGTTDLYIGGIKVVSAADVDYTLGVDVNATSDDAVKFKLISTKNENFVIDKGVTDAFKSGSMKAYLEIINGTNGKYTNINDMKDTLDTAAAAFANAVNKIQTYGCEGGDEFAAYITTDEVTGDLILKRAEEADTLFTTSDGEAFNASNIKINDSVAANPFLVSAARINLANFTDEEGNVGDWTKAIGSSDNAVKFTALQNEKICSYGNTTANNCSLPDFLIHNAAKNGIEASNVAKKAGTSQDIADSAAANYLNLVGVNLDEELADMIKYQRAYEASARVFTTIDSITSIILNMV